MTSKPIPEFESLSDGVVIRAVYQSHIWMSKVDGHPTMNHAESKTPDDCIHKAKAKVLSHCRAVNSQARSQQRKQPYNTDQIELALKEPPNTSGIIFTEDHPIPWAAWEFTDDRS